MQTFVLIFIITQKTRLQQMREQAEIDEANMNRKAVEGCKYLFIF
jgi:hypothetical protein